MARSAKQFFHHARFDPALPPLDRESYARCIAEVVGRNPRRMCPDQRRVVIPGFPHLRAFSEAHADLCRAGLGGAWQSYVQRGHWRMILPWTRRGQRAEAERLARSVRANLAPVVHIFTFPALTLNHAVVAYSVSESPEGFQFATYDPNAPNDILDLRFDFSRREFEMPPTLYFIGGHLDAYEVYSGFFR